MAKRERDIKLPGGMIGKDARVHPNGFIQLDLSTKYRLHFWHPAIPRQKVPTPIHDHIFDMHAVVAQGEMVNLLYKKKRERRRSKREYRAWEPNAKGILQPLGLAVDLAVKDCQLVRRGELYRVWAGEVHQSVPCGPAITVIAKRPGSKEKSSPQIFIPSDTEPDNSFNRYDAMSVDEIQSRIENMMGRACHEALRALQPFLKNDC